MHTSSKIAALAIAASVLAACSGGGGSLTPQSNLSTAPAAPASGASRFIASTAAATNTQDFTYDANPPTKPFGNGAPVTANALPPPSVCEQVYGLACYTPSEIKTAYDVPSQFNGSGQTIVIVDAFGSPTIQSDLHVFDTVMGLPDPAFDIQYPGGQPSAFDGSNNRSGWAGETSLDVEWAHAIAPAATIHLVIAKTNSSTDISTAEAYAMQTYPGSVISMSFGAGEPAIPGGANNSHLQHDDKFFQQAQHQNTTLIASAGDTGATNGTGTLTAEFPASDPSVLSVGGTDLFMSDAGVYQQETVWNDTVSSLCPFGCYYGAFGVTGGAPSRLFRAPSYQQSLFHPDTRETADVSYNAGVYTAVLVAEGFNSPGQVGFYFVGGTSAGAPQWAGIIALANQAAGHSLGFVNKSLYHIAKNGPYASAFHDVTVGNNALFSLPGENAGPGYDMPTGLGSPNVANLITALTADGNSGN